MNMQALCSTDQTRSNIASPFLVELDGAEWLCVTDGAMILALKGQKPEAAQPDNPPRCAMILKSIQTAVPVAHSTVDHLQELFGPMKGDDCPACDGTGETTCRCPKCKTGHQTRCEKCKGTGMSKHFINFLDRNIDAVLLYLLMAHCPDGECDICVEENSLILRGDGWLAEIMVVVAALEIATPVREVTL
jgi:hypothetical protein